MNALESALADVVGIEAMRTGVAGEEYGHDSSELQGLHGTPDAVVAPGSVDDVAAVVAWCYERGIPIVPRGGGTGFAGGAVPVEGGVVLSVECLTTVRRFEPEFWRAHVDAGVTTGRIHQLARESGLMFAPDPGASEQSQIGGNIACNAGGPHSFKYGVMRDWVNGVEVVVGDGRIVRFGGSVRKDVAGYDMVGLMAGSEGTLGVITGAWLRLIPAPEAEIPILAGYPDVASGVAAIMRLYQSGLVPAVLEYFDPGCVSATRSNLPGSLDASTSFLVITEADGTLKAAEELAASIVEVLSTDAVEVRTARTRSDRSELNRWRSGVSFAVSALRGGKMSEDISVPIDVLGEAITYTIELGARHGLPSCSWGHAGDGNLHATFMIDSTSADQVKTATLAVDQLFDFVASVGGTVSGEHGLGWIKREQFERRHSVESVRLQLDIKRAFDPRGLFNPGKKLPRLQIPAER